MIPALVQAGVGLVGSIVGGISAANRRRKQAQFLTQQERDNKAWYDANTMADYTQRADSQNLMRQLRDGLRRNNKNVAGSAIVTGATPEAQAIQKEASGKVISDTFANIGAMGQRWKDNITSQYLARKDNLANQRMGLMDGSARAAENLTQSGLNLMSGGIGGMLGTGVSPQKPQGTLPTQTQWLPLG